MTAPQRHSAGKNVLLFTRPAVVADAAPFAEQMRAEDHREFAAFGDPAEALAEGIRESVWCYVASDKTGFVSCWGVRPTGTLLGGAGYCWCATTPRVLLHKRAFLLGSRAWVEAMRAEFVTLAGWCAADYAVSQRWLGRWLGFELGAVERLGPLGLPYMLFWWRRDE
jgi:hypothetical protein